MINPIQEIPLPPIQIVDSEGRSSVEFSDWLLRLTDVINQLVNAVNTLI